MELFVALNSASGALGRESPEQRVAELCREAGRDAAVTATGDVDALCESVRLALQRGTRTILVGGGDGTLRRVAALLLERDAALGVLPLGSFNHFARDLGIPLGLDDAVRAALGGAPRRVDVGEVNGRVFLNNASLGLYPSFVRLREQEGARGPARWLVRLRAAVRALRRRKEIVVRIRVGEVSTVHRTPIVMVGNNEYRATGLELGTRPSLSGGRLAIYIVKGGGRRHVLRLAWRMLTDRVRDELEVLRAEAATLESRRRRLHVAMDGDVELMAPPLEFRIRPAALWVLLPPEATA
jgi:diacylglycerol kinase family enzyme